ncbi:MAG: hypothetical protein WD275_09070, partial [Rhodothermales bacterium]
MQLVPFMRWHPHWLAALLAAVLLSSGGAAPPSAPLGFEAVTVTESANLWWARAPAEYRSMNGLLAPP